MKASQELRAHEACNSSTRLSLEGGNQAKEPSPKPFALCLVGPATPLGRRLVVCWTASFAFQNLRFRHLLPQQLREFPMPAGLLPETRRDGCELLLRRRCSFAGFCFHRPREPFAFARASFPWDIQVPIWELDKCAGLLLRGLAL